jgi:hypothetical protein
MSKKQLSSGELRIKKLFLEYEKKRLSELDESKDNINLINKIKSNIKLYEKQLEELRKQSSHERKG